MRPLPLVIFDCILNISSAGGDSTDVDVLEFEAMSNGKPKVTEPGV